MIGFIEGKEKLALITAVIILSIASIYFFNMIINDNTALVISEEGAYVIASGTAENNAVLLSSETTGTMIAKVFNEGDTVQLGQIIARLENTTLQSQYDQAAINSQISEENVKLIEVNLKNLEAQNDYTIKQALHAYLSAEGEYQKVIDGVSSEEIAQAEGTVNQARRNMDKMKLDSERSKILLESGSISKSNFETVENNYYSSATQYNSALEQLNLLKSRPTDVEKKTAENKMLQAKSNYELTIANVKAKLQQLQKELEIAESKLEQTKLTVAETKRELDKTIIKSPLEGVVNSLFYKEGELVPAGKAFAEIFDPDQIEVKVYVSELNIGYIKLDQEVNLFVDSYKEQVFKGKVVKINEEAEYTPKNIQTKEERINTVFEVKIKVTDSRGTIKAGMPVDAHIKIGEAVQ